MIDNFDGDNAVNRRVAEIARRVKAGGVQVASLSGERRNGALRSIAETLLKNSEAIFEANSEDMDAGVKSGLAEPLMKRLKFDEQKLKDAVDGLNGLIGLPDPLFRTVFIRQLDRGLTLRRVTCPIGVIGVIFESRPDALIQIASLCLKSGNCAILKGGSEAANTNRVLFELIHAAGVEAGIPDIFLTLIETRADIDGLFDCYESVDLLIPRGSNEFVRYIMERSRVPVMGHSDGVCHIYADRAADVSKAISVIRDAKTQYAAVCNAVECLLVHRVVAGSLLPALYEDMSGRRVTLRGCPETLKIIPAEAADADDFGREYLDYTMAVKVVEGIDEAIDHINRLGSHHTDCILTEDAEAAEHFMLMVDSAGVYQNCSTRFADGFRYGFGAEVGVSTGKLHARGPVGLDGLVTYKYRLYGNGHVVADYAEGRRRFDFRDIPPRQG
jgi:glutamate-5-semialdehyde dehydrogenase